jgi:acetylglutamate kinase
MKRAHDIVVQLLGNFGSEREVRQYLQHYASLDDPKFGVIKVGGAILDEELDALADALTFLDEVKLHPVVVHGAGPQLTRALGEAGIEPTFVDGLRVTTPEVLEVARRVFHDANLRLVDALIARGAHARPITSGVIEAQQSSQANLGLVGEVTRVHDEPLTSCARAGYLPVIAPLGETPTGQTLNVNADVVTSAVARALQPHKVVFLTGTGGLLDGSGRILPAVNLAEDYDRLMAEAWVTEGMRLKVQEIKALLDDLPASSSVSITSPAHLARELFTHKGAGTLLRRGERIERLGGFDDVDKERVRDLLQRCFGRELAPDYFDRKAPIALYLADSYRAVAVVTEEAGVPYLDKFAVTTEAQGAGVGASLWARMTADHPRLFWRARRGNPINGWYFAKAGGAVRDDDWVVFWTGLADFDEIGRVVKRALSLPATIGDHAEGES